MMNRKGFLATLCGLFGGLALGVKAEENGDSFIPKEVNGIPVEVKTYPLVRDSNNKISNLVRIGPKSYNIDFENTINWSNSYIPMSCMNKNGQTCSSFTNEKDGVSWNHPAFKSGFLKQIDYLSTIKHDDGKTKGSKIVVCKCIEKPNLVGMYIVFKD